MSNTSDSKETAVVAARIIRQERGQCTVLTHINPTEYSCCIPKSFSRSGADGEKTPIIGDEVLIRLLNSPQAVLQQVLPRKNELKRVKAGTKSTAQLLAANIDIALIVSSLDGGRNFNLSRIERFLTLTATDGISSILLLNKADLCPDGETAIEQVHAAFPEIPALLVSAHTGMGIEELESLLSPEATVVLLGPSGVGKSALINALCNSTQQAVGALRPSDKRGRHTTTSRRMFQLPNRSWIIDTPGIREVQAWHDAQTDNAFPDIAELAACCRFRDCTHQHEPGCAVQQAVADGRITLKQYTSYIQIRIQQDGLARKRRERERIQAKRTWKKQRAQAAICHRH